MNRKKAAVLLLTLLMVLSLVLSACGGGGKKDGRYEYKGDLDEHGWAVQAWIDVKDGKIVDGFFDYVNDEGKRKSEDQDYIDSMLEYSETGTDISEVISYLDTYLKNNTNLDKVSPDAVSGATSTYENFVAAAKDLYKKAGLSD
ncbi:MAG: hypothetical protein GXY99_01640 [Clostridiaceae bacterium]|mgnify:CR=1 FL=1|jgi:major membrane immunogen (membrane-anchored lipoprotein)|nr:hypothetical protein [Clostridiaceae bacterium]